MSAPESYKIEFEIDGLPRTTNGSHGHWRVKHAHTLAWQKRVFDKAFPLRPSEPLTSARITLTRLSSNEPDFDNLAISFKPVIDGLRRAGVIADDKQSVIGRPEYAWEKTSPRKGRIRVCVTSGDRSCGRL